jgi:hypothetical protein
LFHDVKCSKSLRVPGFLLKASETVKIQQNMPVFTWDYTPSTENPTKFDSQPLALCWPPRNLGRKALLGSFLLPKPHLFWYRDLVFHRFPFLPKSLNPPTTSPRLAYIVSKKSQPLDLALHPTGLYGHSTALFLTHK